METITFMINFKYKNILFLCIFLLLFSLTIKNSNEKPKILKTNKDSSSISEPIKQSTENIADDIKKIIEKGILRVGLYKEDRQGFFEKSGENFQGIDIDIAKKISKHLNVELEFNREAKTYDNLVDLLLNNEVDVVISTFSNTPTRTMYINFSDPYLELRTGIMINKQILASDNIESNVVSYLKKTSQKIGIQKGSSYSKIARDIFTSAEFIEVNNIQESLELTKNAQILGTFCSEIELIEHIIKNPIFSVYAKPFVFSDIKDRFCIGVSKKSPELKTLLNECLKSSGKVSVEDVEKKYIEIFKQEIK